MADAWKMERQLAVNGLQTSRKWSDDQLTELMDTGRVKGFVGDHINTVNGNAALAANHRNIQFSTVAEHNARHAAAGGFRTPISGQQLIDRTRGGQLPDLATSSARGWPDRAKGLGLGVLSGVATGLEIMDIGDPLLGPMGFFNPGSNAGCQTLNC